METVLFIGWSLLGPIVPIIFGKKWPNLLRRIRFISFFTTVYLLGVCFFIWVGVRDNTLFLFTAIVSLTGGLLILSWPLTARRFVKKNNLEW